VFYYFTLPILGTCVVPDDSPDMTLQLVSYFVSRVHDVLSRLPLLSVTKFMLSNLPD